jgi:hypothetical protein
MSRLKEVEEAVRGFSAEDLAAFRTWFAKFDAEVWDRQIGDDVEAGRLDTFAEEALRELREGNCSEW